MTEHAVVTRIKLDGSDATSTLNSLGSASAKADKTTSKFGATMAKVGGVLAIGSIIKNVASEFANYNQQLALISTQTADFTKSQAQIKDSINEVSQATGEARSEVAKGYYEALSSGVQEADAGKFIADAGKLAKAGITDTQTAVDGLTTVLNSYKLSVEDTSRVSDILVKAQDKGKASVGEMANTLGTVIPVAASAGVNFENMGAAYAVLTARGTNANIVATDTKNIINNLGNSSHSLGREFEKLSGTTFKKFIKDGHSLQEAIQLVHDKTKKPLGKIVDRGSINSFVTLAQSADDFSDSLGTMYNSAGATEKGFEQATNNIKDQFNILSQTTLAQLEHLLNGIMEFGTGVLKAITAIPGPIKQVAVSGGILIGIFKTLNKASNAINLSNFGKDIKTTAVTAEVGRTELAFRKADLAQKQFMTGTSPGRIIAQQKAIQKSTLNTSVMYARSMKSLQNSTKLLNSSKGYALPNQTRDSIRQQVVLYRQQEAAAKKSLANTSINWQRTSSQVTSNATKMQKAGQLAGAGVRGFGSTLSFLAGPYGMLLTLGGAAIFSLISQKKELSETEKMFSEVGKAYKATSDNFANTKLNQIGKGIHDNIKESADKVELELTKMNMSFNKTRGFNGLAKSIKGSTDQAIKYLKQYEKEVKNVVNNNRLGLDKGTFGELTLISQKEAENAEKSIKKIEKLQKKVDEQAAKANGAKKGSKVYEDALAETIKINEKIIKEKQKFIHEETNQLLKGYKTQAKTIGLGSKELKTANKIIADEYKKNGEELRASFVKQRDLAEQSGNVNLVKKIDEQFKNATFTNMRSMAKNLMEVQGETTDALKSLSVDSSGNLGMFVKEMVQGEEKLTKVKLPEKLEGVVKAIEESVPDTLKGLEKQEYVQEMLNNIIGGKELKPELAKKIKEENEKVKTETKDTAKSIQEIQKMLKSAKITELDIKNDSIKYKGQEISKQFQKGINEGISPEVMAERLKTAVDAGFNIDGEGIKLNAKNVTDFYNQGLIEGLTPEQIKTNIQSITDAGFNIDGTAIKFKGGEITNFYNNGIQEGLTSEEIHARVQAITSTGFGVDGTGQIVNSNGQNITQLYKDGLKSGMTSEDILARLNAMISAGFTADGSQVMLNGQNVTKQYNDSIEAGLSPTEIKTKLENAIPDNVDKNVKTDVKTDIKTDDKKGETEQKIKSSLPDNVSKNIGVKVNPNLSVGGMNVQSRISAMIPKTINANVAINLNASSNATAVGSKIANQATNALRAGASGSNSIGSFFGSGFVGGIRAQEGAAYSAGLALGNAAKRGAKDAGDVRSPSREMAKLGRFYVQGFTITVDQGKAAAEKVGSNLGKAVINGTKKAISNVKEEQIMSTNYQKMLGRAMALAVSKAQTKEEKEKIIAYYAELIKAEQEASKYRIAKLKVENARDSKIKKAQTKVDKLQAKYNKAKDKKTKANLKKQLASAKKQLNATTRQANADANIKIRKLEDEQKIKDLQKDLAEKLADEKEKLAEEVAEKEAKAIEEAMAKRGLIAPTIESGSSKIVNISQPMNLNFNIQEVRNFDQLMDAVQRNMVSTLEKYLGGRLT